MPNSKLNRIKIPLNIRFRVYTFRSRIFIKQLIFDFSQGLLLGSVLYIAGTAAIDDKLLTLIPTGLFPNTSTTPETLIVTIAFVMGILVVPTLTLVRERNNLSERWDRYEATIQAHPNEALCYLLFNLIRFANKSIAQYNKIYTQNEA